MLAPLARLDSDEKMAIADEYSGWGRAERAQLKGHIAQMQGQLDAEIYEGGTLTPKLSSNPFRST